MPLYKHICQTCGTVFYTNGTDARFCSQDCYPKDKCLWCGKEFIKIRNNCKFCSVSCGKKYRNNTIYRQKAIEESLEHFKNGIENIDYVECKVCGQRFLYLNPQHIIQVHNMTINEYEEKYGKIIYYPSKYIDNYYYGEKYKDRFMKFTDEERKEHSPFCIERYIKLGYSKDDAENLKNNFIEKTVKNRSTTTQINYYIDKGYSMEDAIRLRSERQKTFTLDKCIEKHGKDEGTRIWLERQKKWKEKMYSSRNRLISGGSKECDNLVDEIINNTNCDYLLYGDNEFLLRDEHKHKLYFYDITNPKTNRIIEFNGDFWHGNPDKYGPNDINKANKKKYSDIWKNDKLKNDFAKNKGYDVMVVWESEYQTDKENVIKRCKDFIL